MDTKRFRWVSGGFATLAVVAMAAFYAGYDPPVASAFAPCCQECEAKESACWASCAAASHGFGSSDTAQACNDDCLNALYDEPYGCWMICYYCGPPEPETECWTVIYEESWECVNQQNGQCLQWEPVGGTGGHVIGGFQTGGGFCG